MCYKRPCSPTRISDVSIPFDELPRAFNPPEGYIVTANNAVVQLDFSYFLTAQHPVPPDALRQGEHRRKQGGIAGSDAPVDEGLFQAESPLRSREGGFFG